MNDQQLQQALDTLAKSVGWWMECNGCNSTGVVRRLVMPFASDEVAEEPHELCDGTGRILRYPNFFDSVYAPCPNTKLHSDYPLVECNKCHGTGYVVRPVLEFWWLAPEAIRLERWTIMLDTGITTLVDITLWTEATGSVESFTNEHPILALIEALDKVLVKKG